MANVSLTKTPTYFATKHNSARDEVIALLSEGYEGYGEAASGTTEAPTGAMNLVVLDEECDLDFNDHTNYPLGDEVGELARTYNIATDDVRGAHIVTWNDYGFVSVETFADALTARNEFACRAGRFEAWDDENRDSEDTIYICPVAGHGYHEI